MFAKFLEFECGFAATSGCGLIPAKGLLRVNLECIAECVDF